MLLSVTKQYLQWHNCQQLSATNSEGDTYRTFVEEVTVRSHR